MRPRLKRVCTNLGWLWNCKLTEYHFAGYGESPKAAYKDWLSRWIRYFQGF